AVGETLVEELACHAEQVGHERAAERVVGERPGAPRGDQMAGPQGRQMLRDDRLVKAERVLQVLNGTFTRREQFEDAYTRRVSQGAEQVGLERLELRRH